MSEHVDAIILAGGAGTRIRPVLGDQPKVLAPVRGRPFLDHLLEWLGASEIVANVIVAAGHGAEHVIRHCQNLDSRINVEISVENKPLGTGGALLKALETALGPTAIALNGDSFIDVDLAGVLSVHRASGAGATVVGVRVDDAGRYGTLSLDGNKVLGFTEKDTKAQGPAWINAGVYVIERAAVTGFGAGEISLEREILPRLAGEGLRMFACEGAFIDIGTPADYVRAEEFFAAR